MKTVPKPIKNIDELCEEASEKIDDFFIDTRNYFLENYELLEGEFQIKCGKIGEFSDDSITYLITNGIVLASVMQTRTDYNCSIYTFFRDVESASYLLKDLRKI